MSDPGTQGLRLDAEAARAALIEMVEPKRETALKMSLPHLRVDPVERLDGAQVQIGLWHVDLAEKTFVFSMVAPPVLEEHSGVFTPKPDGGWQAQIEASQVAGPDPVE